MKNFFTLLIATLLSFHSFAQPTNDNCINATTLTMNGSLVCGTTDGATVQRDEYCAASGGGITPKTVWYRFTATNTTHIINLLRTNNINCFGRMSVFGPNPSCLPNSSSAIYDCVLLNGDPGVYPELTGLTPGATYLIQYNGQECGGSGDRFHNICIGVYTPASNNSIANPLLIDACGTSFNGTTQGGYSASGSGTSRSNFDNASTTCSGCGTGNDVPYVINNDSWFTFCSGIAGTWNVTFNVGTCVFSGTNSGAQMSILTGTPTSLSNIANAPSPLRAGLSWTSPNFNLSAGGCAYLVVDGFAGDACSYSYTLTDLSGGCVFLATQVSKFTSIQNLNQIEIKWANNQEEHVIKYVLEKSADAINFASVADIEGLNNGSEYSFVDRNPTNGYNYYRLKVINYDGTESLSKMTVVYFEGDNRETVSVYPNPITDEINLKWQQIGDSPVYINIKDLSGKEVYNEKISTNEGINKIIIQSNNFPLGLYILRIQNEQNSKQTTFIKN